MDNGQKHFEVAVEELLAAAAPNADSPKLLQNGVRHLTEARGAKRLRPQLIYFVGAEFGASWEELAPLGAAAELIHTASLLHDDVVDESGTRRGKSSANAVVGNAAAVLSGDWLLAEALYLLRTTPNEVRVGASKVLRDMSHAAVWEVELRGSSTAQPSDWQRVAVGKTGALFAWCAASAAIASPRASEVSLLLALGEKLGIAFQRADDLKDVLLEDTGKPRFADLRNRNLSSTVIAACEDRDFAEQLTRAWTQSAVAEHDVLALGHALASAPSTAREIFKLQEEIAQIGDLAARALGRRASERLLNKLSTALELPHAATASLVLDRAPLTFKVAP